MAKAAKDRIGAGDIQDLAIAVEQLSEETRVLRQSLDEMRDDVVWAARQVLIAGNNVAPAQMPNRPADPLAPDADSLQDERHEAADTSCESVIYCCEKPNLTWNGDPQAPGISCDSCGYVVAALGDVVIWRSENEIPATTATSPYNDSPKSRQSELF